MFHTNRMGLSWLVRCYNEINSVDVNVYVWSTTGLHVTPSIIAVSVPTGCVYAVVSERLID